MSVVGTSEKCSVAWPRSDRRGEADGAPKIISDRFSTDEPFAIPV
jgi:hypothetical protein